MFKKKRAALSTHQLAVLALIAVAFGYSFLGVASRLLAVGFEPFSQVFIRLVLGTAIAVGLFWPKLRWRHVTNTPKKDYWGLFMAGVPGYGIAVYFVTLATLTTKLVNVAVFMSMMPFFAFIYSLLVLGSKANFKLSGLVTVSFFGASMMATGSFVPILDQFGFGDLFGLISVALFAWYGVGRKMLSSHLNNQEITIVTMGLATITTLVLAVVKGETLVLSNLLIPLVAVGALLGAGLNIIASFFENFAFEHLDATKGSQILLVENFFSLVVGFLLYGEIISLPEAIGALIILGSAYVSNRLSNGH